MGLLFDRIEAVAAVAIAVWSVATFYIIARMLFSRDE